MSRNKPVHGHTTNARPPTEPATPTGLAQITVLPERVADLADSGDAVLEDLAHLAALQADLGVLARVFMRDDLAERASGTDEERAPLRVQRDVVDDGARRNEPDRHDVAGLDGDRTQHTERKRRGRGGLCLRAAFVALGLEDLAANVLRIHEAGHQAVRDALTEALHHVSSAQGIRGQDVAPYLPPAQVGVAVLDECNMGRATRVVLDTHDVTRTRIHPHEVDDTYALFVAASTVPNGDVTVVISSTAFPQSNGQLAKGPSCVEVRRKRPLEVANTRRDGLVGFVENGCPREGGVDL